MAIRYVLFDVDNTLYPASSGLLHEINQRMTAYMAALLSVSEEEASITRQTYREQYGTTLSGLVHHHGLEDVNAFLEYCHPTRLDSYLTPDPDLQTFLASLPVPASILTNSPMEHARRVLQFLGIEEYFQHVFDIRYNGFRGKPSKELFQRVLAHIGMPAEEVLLVDDGVEHVRAFGEMGGAAVLVHEHPSSAEPPGALPTIRTVVELRELLRTLDPASGALGPS
jgi:putative hydrolase of the HAD superfamily